MIITKKPIHVNILSGLESHALKSNGFVSSSRMNDIGQFGIDSTNSSNITQVVILSNSISVDALCYHSLTVKPDGTFRRCEHVYNFYKKMKIL